jgi:hypothetical protein
MAINLGKHESIVRYETGASVEPAAPAEEAAFAELVSRIFTR